MNKNMLVALCAFGVASLNAVNEGTITVTYTEPSMATKAFQSLKAKTESTENSLYAFLTKTFGSLEKGAIDFGAAIKKAHVDLNTQAELNIPWFKQHSTTFAASKVIVATTVLAATALGLKKAYDAVKAYKAKRA